MNLSRKLSLICFYLSLITLNISAVHAKDVEREFSRMAKYMILGQSTDTIQSEGIDNQGAVFVAWQDPVHGGVARMIAKALDAVRTINKRRDKTLLCGALAAFNSDGPQSLVKQIKSIHETTGKKVKEIHILGHGQGSFDNEVYELSVSAARKIRPYVTDDVKIIFHGYQLIANSNHKKFLAALPPGATIYGHFGSSSPGQPFDWVKYQKRREGDGSMSIIYTKMGKANIIGEIFPREYVQAWIDIMLLKQHKSGHGNAIDFFLTKFHASIPQDVEEMMRASRPE